MTGVLIAVACLGGACAYVVGHAFVAPRTSILRSTGGGILLAACVLVAVFGPMTLVAILRATGGWSSSVRADTFQIACAAVVALGLLGGVRVWRMRLFSPNAGLFRLDESPVSRAEAELPLAKSLADALDVLAREKVSQRDIARIAPVVRRVGSRHFHQVPERKSEAYALVSQHLPAAVAADVTGLLLEGAGRT